MHRSNNPRRRMKQRRPIVLTPEQVRALLDATENQPAYRDLHDVARIMLRSGIEPVELARLRWTDFTFGLRVMRVNLPETGIIRGTIMDRETVALLQARCDRAGDTEFVMGSFPDHVMARVARQFRCIAKKLGFPACGLHILCRTARSEAIANRRKKSEAVAH